MTKTEIRTNLLYMFGLNEQGFRNDWFKTDENISKLQLRNLAIALLDVHGLTLDGWKFKWNSHKRSFGVCDYMAKTIFLSTFLYDNTLEKDKFVDTIKHEVAHALTPRAGHGRAWKIMASRIGAIPKSSSRVEKVDMLKGAKHVVVNTLDGINEVVRPYFRQPPAKSYNRIRYSYVTGKPQTQGHLKIITVREYRKLVG